MRTLSPKVLRELREVVQAYDRMWHLESHRLLVAAIDRALSVKRSVKAASSRRSEKKATKKQETAFIRSAVFARAGGRCELDCGREATDLEHVFGRVRVHQAPSNCLALCHECHLARTAGKPSHSHWWAVYREVLLRHGHTTEARLCEVKLDAAREREAA